MSQVSIVVPARNDAAALESAVNSCLAQSAAGIDEILIAVGPSADDTHEVARNLARRHPTVHVIDNPTGRTPRALNLAIQAATGDVIVRVDARSELPPDYVANALELMEATGAANIGAVQRPVGYSPVQRAIAAAMKSRVGSGGAKYRTSARPQKVDTAYLGVFDRAAVLEVGGYDESFVRNQDAELNERLNRAGHEVWLDPRLVVDYQPRSSLRTLGQQYWQYGWWRRRTIRKHRGSMRLRQLIPVLAMPLVACSVVIAIWVPLAAVIPATYIAGVVGACIAASGLSIGERFAMAAALTTMHTGWAAGFLTSSAQLRARD